MGLTFTEAELRKTEDQGHQAWHDGFCQCSKDNGFIDTKLFDIDHLIEIMKQNRENDGKSS